MSGMSPYRKVLLLVITTVMLPVVTSCGDSDVQWVQDMAVEWAQSKDIFPTKADGKPNPKFLENLAYRAVGVSTGDEDADAALDAMIVIQKIQAVDKLAEEGFKTQDASKLDSAIQMRPADYSYRNMRGVVLLRDVSLDERNKAAAERDFAEADKLAGSMGSYVAARNLKNRLEQLSGFTGVYVREQACKDATGLYQMTGETAALGEWGCAIPAGRVPTPITAPATGPTATTQVGPRQ